MNPPSALNSAMNRDRKPFTYTPGGLDLSEIKSQRMAQRLMRNAMNPGVPEVSPILPSSMPTPMTVALPNFNCLPVQVFPTMPANPKTLLRSRSNPDPRQAPIQRLNPPAFVNNMTSDNINVTHSYDNKPTYSQQLNNNRPLSMYEYTTRLSNDLNAPRNNCENNGYATNLIKPAFIYTPVAAPVSAPKPAPVFNSEPASTTLLSDISYEAEFLRMPKICDESINKKLPELETALIEDNISNNVNINKNVDLDTNLAKDSFVNVNSSLNSMKEDTLIPAVAPTKIVEENINIDNEQKEVKIVKKQVIKEKKVEEQNGNQNGDTNEEANMTITLPTKKSAAKTETKVEVEKKVLPDGTIEEIKTTTTTTTIDGRTEIKTKTEKKTIPKAEEYEEEVEEEEEEEEEVVDEEVKEETDEVKIEPEIVTVTKTIDKPKENGNILKTEERSETTVAKKVVVIQESEPEQSEVVEEEEVEDSEVEEAEEVTVVLKKQVSPEPDVESKPITEEEVIEDKEEAEEVEDEPVPVKKGIDQAKDEVEEELEIVKQEVDEQQATEEVAEEEIEEDEIQKNVEEKINESQSQSQDNEEEQEDEEEYEEAEEEKRDLADGETKENKVEEKQVEEQTENVEKKETDLEHSEQTLKIEEHIIPVQISTSEDPKSESKEEKPTETSTEFKIPIREPSIPLDKVEDVEIKPIGITPIITKTHTENTEIITSNIDPSTGLSKQTEYNKIENIVTVNRTTKILDHNYENLTQQGIPTVKTYFAPPNIDRISTSPMLSRVYQPVYAPEPTSERRHSLLLERLSMERQMPTDIYQYSNQTHEQTQYQEEPQSEILTVSNVKPSSITNQQWYQQTKQSQNVLYNNVSSTPTSVGCPWVQPKSPQPQQQYQPQPQSQPQYNPPSQPQYQTQYQAPQPQFPRGTTPQPQFQGGTTPQPQFQKSTSSQPQYQPTYSEPNLNKTPPKSHSTYTPTWLGSTVDSTSNQYSYTNTDTTQNYQTSTFSSSNQKYSSEYVPPPWEQDSNYTSVNNTSETFYREIPESNTFSPTPSQGWRAAPAPAKFTKPSPIAYVPPAPNQSFVKTGSMVEPPRLPGRKTYYSEYERRYITVPESTYIPTETKFQPQPDPSPQYYYDNNEPTESVEPQWRRELREFTEKTSQTTEQTNIQPPWEVDSKYSKTPSSTYTPTPTWSQTLRPQSYRKRSFESEFVSQEWPKTNTLGRGRPLSTMGKSLDGAIPERARGVSVDRYNPNNYQPPAEHPPVQSHTLTTPLPHAGYHNPNVPAYHARASAEPREQPVNYQQRVYRESRASPLQSRSFKYLQWITGTEN